jgi:hypothetical protein
VNKKLLITGIVIVLLSLAVVPIKSERSEYGGCDIAERTERVDLILGGKISEAKEQQIGCFSYITYKLYVL